MENFKTEQGTPAGTYAKTAQGGSLQSRIPRCKWLGPMGRMLPQKLRWGNYPFVEKTTIPDNQPEPDELPIPKFSWERFLDDLDDPNFKW